ncbi:MAG: DEAD/DEAH box helicase [Bacteroidetes bacterium]|nr:DEAD/DEAH box helicase [Bacteroidota bacterium]
MSSTIKNQQEILDKLNIKNLNPMQEEALLTIQSNPSTVLLSPTGTGKTLAFLLPIIDELDPEKSEIQVLIIVPSRELAIQIEQVIRQMGTGYKAIAVYGGRSGSQDMIDIKHPPAILIGTPGRIADHLRRERFSTESINTLVLDEFDKSLEIGFESEMIEIADALPKIQKKILTSATQRVEIPAFVGMRNPAYLDYSHEQISNLKIKTVLSSSKDKLDTLLTLLDHIGNQPGIIFCNFKDTIQNVSDYLTEKKVNHGCFYGGMEQKDRERALIKFRNGTHQIIIATDLAARGIDVPEIKFIIHYQFPLKKYEFTHRNGRTARMHKEGTAYVIQWVKEDLPDFINVPATDSFRDIELKKSKDQERIRWSTLFVSGGRKDKISKGDIAGLCIKQGGLTNDQIGIIELKQDCAFVGVHESEIENLISSINNTKLKKKKIRVTVI